MRKYDIIKIPYKYKRETKLIMRRNYFKDLKWHILLLILSLFFVCKYSSAPPILDELNVIFQKPKENTLMYEIIRIAENLSLAYIASLIFYLLVDYIPLIKEENNTLRLLEKHLYPLYMYMDKVNSYFKYATGVSNINTATNKEIEIVDGFYFSKTIELLMIKSIRNGKDDGEHLELFETKKSIISYGKKIEECIHDIDNILISNKAPIEFVTLINQIRSCNFLETILKVMPEPEIIIEGQPVAQTYIGFYKELAEFSDLEAHLNKYQFLKLGTIYRQATIEEIQEWKDYQSKIRKEHPEIDQIYAQLNNSSE